MPAVAFRQSIAATPVATGGTGPVTATGATWVATGASVTLTAGRWLIRPNVSHVNASGAGGVTSSSQVELRQNAARIGVNRWCSFYGAFRPTSGALSGGAIGGSALKGFAVITAAASDTVTAHVSSHDSGSGHNNALAGDAVIEAVNLDTLVLGTDYVYAESANSDTADIVAAGTTWVTSSAASRIGPSGGRVSLTIPSTGVWWIIACAESFISGAPSGSEVAWCRLRRIDGTPTTIGSGQESNFTHNTGSPSAFVHQFVEEDVRSFTAGEQPEIELQFRNVSGGVACGVRRVRILMVRLAAFRNATVASPTIDGLQQVGAGVPESVNGLTFNYGSNVNVYVSCSPTWQSGGGNWGAAHLHRDAGDVHYPELGRIEAFDVARENIGSGGDYTCVQLPALLQNVSGSQTMRLALETLGGVNHTLGRTQANTGDATTQMVAFELYTPDLSGDFAGIIAATSTHAANIRGDGRLAGTIACATTHSAAVQGAARFVGTIACAETQTGALTGAGRIAGTVAAASTQTASLRGAGAFTGTAAGASTQTAQLAGSGRFAGTCVGATTHAATLRGTAAFGGTSTGTATVVGSARGAGVIGGSIAGVATLAAQFSEPVPTLGEFAGNIAATTTAIGAFRGAGRFGGTISAAATFRWGGDTVIGELSMALDDSPQFTLIIDESVRFTMEIDE